MWSKTRDDSNFIEKAMIRHDYPDKIGATRWKGFP
jgi:hypothetical protein